MLGLNFAAQPAAFAVVVSRTCSANVVSPWSRLDDYSAALAHFVSEREKLICERNSCADGYACAAAERIGMVMGLDASVAESMWQ